MPQSQNADYSSGSNNNTVAIAVAPHNSQYTSNTPMPSQISMLNSTVPTQTLMSAALHLNQSSQGYINPGLATLGYIYPNTNSFVQAPNLVFNPHNVLHPSVDMLTTGPSSLGHLGNVGMHQNHKLGGYDNVQHFGSLPQNPSRKPKNSVMSKTNLYINGLQEFDTDESVRALVDGIIDPKSCKAMMSHGKCRGSGFIDCANEIDAETVIQILRNKQMPGGSRLAVKFAYENEKDDLNVYVRNLPRNSSFNNNSLEDLFKEYGQVVSVKLLQSDNQYTGTGFVRFSTVEEAQKAVDQMNGKKLMITEEDKPVICKLADKGGRRMNHGLINTADAASHNVEGIDHTVNGTMPQISPEGADRTSYGMPLLSGQHQYVPQAGHAWLNQANSADLLMQELQALGLGQSYLLPGLMPGAVNVPSQYSDEAALQQQQLLAQLVWSQHAAQRMMAPTPTASYHPHQHPHPSQVLHQHTQPMIHWPSVHHNQHPITANNTYIYYSPEPSYQTLIYPPHAQYRQSRPVTNATLKSTSAIESPINGQVSSNQPIMNGNAIIEQQHQPPKCKYLIPPSNSRSRNFTSVFLSPSLNDSRKHRIYHNANAPTITNPLSVRRE